MKRGTAIQGHDFRVGDRIQISSESGVPWWKKLWRRITGRKPTYVVRRITPTTFEYEEEK